MTDQPLSHLRVLDLSRLQPGAFCTGVLADLGADVLRIEPPKGGDPLRMLPGAPAAYHRGKRAMTLDLKHARAPEVLRRLVAEVDVVVESGLPAALRQQGIGYEQLAADQPGLVWCSISGFGTDSPYADRAAHDISFLGYSGLLALMAGDAVPSTPDFVLAVPYGALIGVVGILAALTARDRTGEGRFVDTSIADAATWVIGEAVARVAVGGQAGCRRRRAAHLGGTVRGAGAARPRRPAGHPARRAGGAGRRAGGDLRQPPRRRVGRAAPGGGCRRPGQHRRRPVRRPARAGPRVGGRAVRRRCRDPRAPVAGAPPPPRRERGAVRGRPTARPR